ncbi:ABC transporter ATP-binding protein [Gehongia tenuis]|uniref:ABC transporter ATP-binding protein n=1 Tax=Gehongia tenuis TaxID=2763655 RepID=A0A926HQW8_9FIRM|nr:ABC transporter ATP-binding protein [Gehongia tenuis]
MIRKFIAYYRPHMKLFVMDMIAAFLIAVCDLFYPVITRNMINIYIPNQNIRLLLLWGGILLGLYFAKMLFNYFVQYYGHLVGVGMQADMRRDVFRHLQRLPFSFYDENKTGTIMSRMINDLMEIAELAHHGPEDLFVSSVMLIGAFIYLCTINVLLTVIIFAFIPVLVFFAARMRLRMNAAFLESRVKIADVNATLENSISGIRVAKAFTNEAYEVEKFQKGNRAFQRARKKSYKAMAQFSSGTTFIVDLLNVVVLVAGGLFTYYGKINFGDLVAYMLFISMFLSPIKRLIAFVEQYQQGMTGFKRFVELMNTEPEQESPNARELTGVQGAIRFEKVNFSYPNGRQILKDVNLDIPAGRTVALVGPSGGGKTTICHLIPHFYEPDSGRITIDGVDIRDISFSSLRSSIGIVQQDVFLFTGSIRDNIAYGRLDATDEEIVQAAIRANIHEYVMSLPDGYNTDIGERGTKLSGGQKQRVAIARVFLKNPPILILDEATSALDNTTEILIQRALEELSAGRTTLVVAHRLSTIKNADEIIVVDEEGIEERGTHEELIDKGGIYRMLYESQFKGWEE